MINLELHSKPFDYQYLFLYLLFPKLFWNSFRSYSKWYKSSASALRDLTLRQPSIRAEMTWTMQSLILSNIIFVF